MRKYDRWVSGAVTAALLVAVALTGAAPNAAAQEKKVKDQAEYDIYSAASKDLNDKNGAKAVQDLDTWKQKYPDSDYKNDREAMYVQAYDVAKQYDKVLDKAKELMGQNLDTMFPDPKDGPKMVSQVLFPATTAIV